MIAGTPKIEKTMVQKQIAIELKIMTLSEDFLACAYRPAS